MQMPDAPVSTRAPNTTDWRVRFEALEATNERIQGERNAEHVQAQALTELVHRLEERVRVLERQMGKVGPEVVRTMERVDAMIVTPGLPQCLACHGSGVQIRPSTGGATMQQCACVNLVRSPDQQSPRPQPKQGPNVCVVCGGHTCETEGCCTRTQHGWVCSRECWEAYAVKVDRAVAGAAQEEQGQAGEPVAPLDLERSAVQGLRDHPGVIENAVRRRSEGRVRLRLADAPHDFHEIRVVSETGEDVTCPDCLAEALGEFFGQCVDHWHAERDAPSPLSSPRVSASAEEREHWTFTPEQYEVVREALWNWRYVAPRRSQSDAAEHLYEQLPKGAVLRVYVSEVQPSPRSQEGDE